MSYLVHHPSDFRGAIARLRPELRGLSVPGDIYIHISGIDLIRGEDGSYMVLEDNVRCPSGVSYVLENRRVMKHVFPNLFDQYDVRTVDDYPQKLREVLENTAPRTRGDPVIVVLTPGIHNSAYFEHSFLAQQMGVQLVEGQDLVVNGGLYTKFRSQYLDVASGGTNGAVPQTPQTIDTTLTIAASSGRACRCAV